MTKIEEHIEMVREHKPLFARAISELKYSVIDLTKVLVEGGVEVSSSALKKALESEKLILTIPTSK